MKPLLLITVALAACSGELDDLEAAAPSSAPMAEQYGLVVLSRAVGERGIAVSGQLLDYAGVDRAAALAALATPDDVWLTAPEPARGACHALTIDADAIGIDARVDVLDAGPLRIDAPDAPGLVVQPRELPPVVATIGGVVYDAADADALPAVVDRVVLDAPGSETGPITGTVRAPAAVELLGFELDADGLMVHGSGPGLLLLSRLRGARTVGLLCGLGTDALHVDPATLAHLGEGPADLTLLSVRRAPLLIDGADAGDLLFVVRDADELTIPREF